jgi:phosphohistidine phosphatase
LIRYLASPHVVDDAHPREAHVTRRIALLRHAKSDWPEGLADELRPLAPRGRRDAPTAGVALESRVGIPDRVLVSPAVRAVQTWELAAGAMSERSVTEIVPTMYNASVDELLQLLRELDDEVTTVALVGHNPATAQLAAALSDSRGDDDSMARMAAKYPTAGLAVLETEENWTDLAAGTCRLMSFEAPRG